MRLLYGTQRSNKLYNVIAANGLKLRILGFRIFGLQATSRNLLFLLGLVLYSLVSTSLECSKRPKTPPLSDEKGKKTLEHVKILND